MHSNRDEGTPPQVSDTNAGVLDLVAALFAVGFQKAA